MEKRIKNTVVVFSAEVTGIVFNDTAGVRARVDIPFTFSKPVMLKNTTFTVGQPFNLPSTRLYEETMIYIDGKPEDLRPGVDYVISFYRYDGKTQRLHVYVDYIG